MGRGHLAVGYDGSAASREALRWAVREAAERDVMLLLVTACPPPVPAAGSAATSARTLWSGPLTTRGPPSPEPGTNCPTGTPTGHRYRVVPADDPIPGTGQVVVGVDASRGADVAAEEADARGVPLVAVHVARRRRIAGTRSSEGHAAARRDGRRTDRQVPESPGVAGHPGQ
jgi:nucleotide-binding universal stress UspA family protein